MSDKTCRTCRHMQQSNESMAKGMLHCGRIAEFFEMPKSDDVEYLVCPPLTFGCNLWDQDAGERGGK
jgi:hypothetical protein